MNETEQIRWLIEVGDLALSDSPASSDPLELVTRFRKQFDAAQTRLLCELHELRQRARVKFSRADRMFFTRRGYEQATSEKIAQYKATRFPAGERIVDLCCGIGGDALALGRRSSKITLIDRSPATVALAVANLGVYDVADIQVCADDVRNVSVAAWSAWHIDPDRRVDGQRRSAPEKCEPPLDEFLQQIPKSGKGMLPGAVKLSPAARPDHLLEFGAELEWIGDRRECQQLVAWFGSLAEFPGRRTATCLIDGGAEKLVEEPAAASTALASQDEQPSDVSDIKTQLPRYLFEPRPCVLAAQLEDTLGRKFNLQRLAERVPLFGSSERVATDLVSSFETIAAFPFRMSDVAQHRTEIARQGLQITEVKKRGVDLDPATVLRQLRSKDASAANRKAATLFVFPAGRSLLAVVAQRCQQADGAPDGID